MLGGYNPHNLADSSQVTSALSQLLLPSVFRQKDDGSTQLDKSLMKSAEVLSQQPFVVAYEIRPDASWSDGAPIAAEDFDYLRTQMRDQPGVIGPAGYRQITDLQSREGGKRVEVTFAKPYPGWQTLFSDLLPAHLLKDAPDGWRGALASNFPAVAGPFSIKSLDIARGEVVLERNERYWEKPAAIDRIVLRRSDQQTLLAALHSGNDQFALARTTGDGLKRLGELGPAVKLHTVARPLVADVLLRPVSATLHDDQVRAGIAALIDRTKLITEGVDGGPSSALHADAQVKAPSVTGYTATHPARPAHRARRRQGRGVAEGGRVTPRPRAPGARTARRFRWSSPRRAPRSRTRRSPRSSPASSTAQGIEVNAITPQPRDLFSGLLAMPVAGGVQQPTGDSAGNVGIDIAVVPQAVGGDTASVLASTFGCRLEQTTARTRPNRSFRAIRRDSAIRRCSRRSTRRCPDRPRSPTRSPLLSLNFGARTW